ncbi:cytotoxic translational repressor of toxin-antitoxin stability system [Sandarakinorhabdus cyanobacteriorum]|uniref:Cytotoxic translational repressor of toxin-antitoxin stability system n=1 Tax=Sandarakinorhabdus cyanobacteriorum TaxID=1981098 RepID=A0A255Y8S4_9SPHN|nr:type II toxin-antitoxin system RelE/ParE family toxin [Sandarakinorhabdus cyanobacteriorum]OYQ24995.1 cytotoxic translational repressor of toxin-antitoxin stability system [Sandarakinorhabdus cyanobacteriorum]
MTGRRVEYSRQAAKTLMRIDAATSARIRLKIRQLAGDPAAQANNILPMKGCEGLFRLRVGDWRVVYTETLVIVSVIRIGPRGDVYD